MVHPWVHPVLPVAHSSRVHPVRPRPFCATLIRRSACLKVHIVLHSMRQPDARCAAPGAQAIYARHHSYSLQPLSQPALPCGCMQSIDCSLPAAFATIPVLRTTNIPAAYNKRPCCTKRTHHMMYCVAMHIIFMQLPRQGKVSASLAFHKLCYNQPATAVQRPRQKPTAPY